MTYTDEFYVSEGKQALDSARVVLPYVLHEVKNVVDVGCGTGAWAWTAQEAGRDVLGVDHDVPANLRHDIPYEDHDLSQVGFPCDGYDLAICLEVAEHLPASAAESLVEGLVRAREILFSAATPGQPGVNHMNCRPHDYWHERFAVHQKLPMAVGHLFTDPVADYYQRNMFLYR